MSFRTSERELVDAVGRRLSRVLAARSIKQIQAVAGGVSHPTASNYRRGELPECFAPFFAILKAFGPDATAVMDPVLNDAEASQQSARLSAMAASLKEMVRHVEEISLSNRTGRDGLRSVLGFRRASRAGVAAGPSGGGRDVGGEVGDAVGGAGRPSRASGGNSRSVD